MDAELAIGLVLIAVAVLLIIDVATARKRPVVNDHPTLNTRNDRD